MTQPPPLLHLAGPDVIAAMPPMRERLALAERALRSLGHGAELPSKIGVHPRPDASWAHAMPAWVPGAEDDAASDLLGVKFVSGFPANGAQGLPALHATLLLCDAATGRPRAILDAGAITAARTAAISGVAVAAWAPSRAEPTVALIGAGIQGEAHVEMLGAVLPGSHLRIHDRDRERAARLARSVPAARVSGVTAVDDAVEAVRGADVVITMVSFGPKRQTLPADAVADAGLVVTVDYDMCLPAAVARDAAMFLVDEAGQFLANRASGIFRDYPDPSGTIGDRLDDPRPSGQVVVVHLGTGVADLVFGDAVLHAAEAQGLGTPLPG
jgi:ornithine cyclodeaminase/alanine dehydrogenase-like protein (mu-crystallin family)